MQHTPTLYGFPVSPHVRAARIAFHEKGIPVDFREIGPDYLKTEEYAAINPFRKMPALQIEGSTLYETPALMAYANAFGSGASLEPSDGLQRARMWQFVGIAQSHLYPVGVMKLYFHSVLAPVFGLTADAAAVSESTAPTGQHLDAIEAGLGGTYIAADHLSFADIYCGTMVDYIDRTRAGRALVAARPRLHQWLQNLRGRESFKSTFAPMLAGTDQA